mgnify:CR=1 FL=1
MSIENQTFGINNIEVLMVDDASTDTSAEIIKEQEMIKQLAMQFAGSNLVDPETLFIMATSKSLTEMREAAIKSLREKKAENNQLQQLQQLKRKVIVESTLYVQLLFN